MLTLTFPQKTNKQLLLLLVRFPLVTAAWTATGAAGSGPDPPDCVGVRFPSRNVFKKKLMKHRDKKINKRLRGQMEGGREGGRGDGRWHHRVSGSVWVSHRRLSVDCLCCSGQGCAGESESTAEAAGGRQVQPRHAGLHHERGVWR